LRELPKKLRQFLKPKRLLLKPTLVPVVFLLVFFLVVGFFAITQETGDADNPNHGDSEGDSLSLEDEENALEPEFIPASPPRWFRSNAGGMALEEIPSRLGALRNKYALVIDYVASDELDSRLTPFYKDEYIIEIRILYIERKESRKQWLFRDESGNTRVNAVFRLFEGEGEVIPDEPGEPALAGDETDIEIADTETAASTEAVNHSELALADTEAASSLEDDGADTEAASAEIASGEEAAAEAADAAPGVKHPEIRTPSGFIEVYNEKSQIAMDYSLFVDGAEILTEYVYNGSALIRAETRTKDPDGVEYRRTHTDTYRYNRSYSLRNVERVFHESSLEPVRLLFPGRVLAYDKDFLKEKLTLVSDFFGSHLVDADYRIVYDTDSKGRVLGETLYNSNNEVVWTMKNTWVGDRITAILKIEGEDRKLTEYDYDASGNRIAERDIRNGILERQVLINGAKETEELYLNGVVVLRAFWEDGRKISEERVRRR
jgi:YD repeat-containing protein